MGSLRGVARLVVLALLWGSSFFWIKLALGGFAPVQIAFGRLLLGAAVLLALVLAGGRRLPRGRALWLRLLVPAFFGNALPFTLFAVAEQTVGSGVAGVLNATTPLWALLIGLLLGSERWSNVTRLAGLLLGFGGVLLICLPGSPGGEFGGWGAVGCLVAAASYAVSYTYIARVLSGRIPPLVLATTQLGTAAVLTGVALPVTGGVAFDFDPAATLALGVLGVFGTGFAFVLNNRIIAEEGATAAASVGYLLPVVSVLLGALLLDEPLNPWVLLGMVVVLAGVLLSRSAPAAAARPADAAVQPRAKRVIRMPAQASQARQTRRRSEAQRDSS